MTHPAFAVDTTKVVYWGAISQRAWHLSGVGAGREGVVLGSDPKGYLFAPVSLLVSEGARQDGATFLRSVRSKKEIDWVVHVGGDMLPTPLQSPRDFHAVNDAWWRDWSTDAPGTLGFFTRHQGWRFHSVRLDAAPEPTTGMDPARNLHEAYSMGLVALDPLARHLGEWDVWTNSDGANEGRVRVRNAADQPGWPRYTMPGPGRYSLEDPSGATLPRVVDTPKILAGETLRIDTHPRHRTARVTSAANPAGRNVWGQLGGRRWISPVPPWSTTDLVVRCSDGATSAASVRVDLTPRASRPW
ncbi:phage tail protein [Nocardia sp. NPDC059240]|uniref:phage tail protein n=1 Tax=Nocardia sp. NPDC059240 TaxID=3346786 RepID=UPI0036B3F6C9